MTYDRAKAARIGKLCLAGFVLLLILACAGYLLWTHVIVPGQHYREGEALCEIGDYAAAEEAFERADDYRDAEARANECGARALFYNKDYAKLYDHLEIYGLSDSLANEMCSSARNAIDEGNYSEACSIIQVLVFNPDAQLAMKEALYDQACVHYDQKEHVISNELFEFLDDYKDSAQKIHEHEFILTTQLPPTCEEYGKEEYTCSCGGVETKTIPATGHDYSEATCTQPATCRTCGAATGTTLPHDPSAPTCTQAGICSVCKQTVGTALGHALVDCVCTRCGKVEISLSQLQGTWVHSEGYTTMRISGSSATVYWHTGGIVYTGPVQLTDYGFYVEGTYESVDNNGNSFTARIKDICYISKFTSTYFVDTFDDNGPFKWYKQ